MHGAISARASTFAAGLDAFLGRLSRGLIVIVAAGGTALVAFADYASGDRISVALFYLAPVAVAAWYGGRVPAVGIAVLSCLSWLGADLASRAPEGALGIAVWNALVRLGFFLINGLLLVALKDSLLRERELARTDALTGALSRRAFEHRLQHDLDRARRESAPLTLALLDLDDFKRLNDTHGHSVGDEALRKTVDLVRGGTRRDDAVARLGGDEFAIVLPGTGARGAEEAIGKLAPELNEALAGRHGIACSIGVVTFEEIPPTVDEAVRAADAQMYDAKRRGKAGVVFSVIPRAQVAQVPGRARPARRGRHRADCP